MPFVVVILRQAFLDLPVELEESALIDGADHWGAFWRIALPLVAPAIAATALIIFGRAWNEFLFALAISAKSAITVPVHMAGTAGTRGVQFWYLAVRQMIAIPGPDRAARPTLHRPRPYARRREGLRLQATTTDRWRRRSRAASCGYPRILIRDPSTIHSRLSNGSRSSSGNAPVMAPSTSGLSCRAGLSTITPDTHAGWRNPHRA